jgi:hypothetical protein
MIEHTSKRLKLLTERSQRVLRDLEGANGQQERDLKKYTAELDVAKRDLEKMRRERERVLEELRKLEGENAQNRREQKD